LTLRKVNYGTTKVEEKIFNVQALPFVVKNLKAADALTNENVLAIRPGLA